jgi:branched-chain amino acid transport system substrate-binding protein
MTRSSRARWGSGLSARLLVLLAVAMLAIAAGCGGDDEGGGDTGGGDTGSTESAETMDIATCGEAVGEGEKLVVSDLPLQGASREQTEEMVEGIKFIFEQANFTAGGTTLTFQSCDDATAQVGAWTPETCTSNANAYAQNTDLIGVIGTFNSGCAQIEVPIANRAPEGPLAYVSPTNTWPGLTQAGPGTLPGEPDKYYPSGKRNYARVVAVDNSQGAADALLAQELGVESVYVLNDTQSYGIGVANYFTKACEKIGIDIAGEDKWDPKQSNYQALMQKIAQTGADAVFLGGIVDNNGAQLIKDKVSILGDNEKVKLIAPDGFTQQSTIDDAGPTVAEGMYMSVAGVPPDELSAEGKQFIEDFMADQGLDTVEPYTAYGAAAAQLMLHAIEASDGSRASVADNILNTTVDDSVLGTFTINENGDVDARGMTIYVAKDGALEVFKPIVPPDDLVAGL